MLWVVASYAEIHGIQNVFQTGYDENQGFQAFNEQVATFNFIGITSDTQSPSFFSVWVEVFIWSLLGVMARQLYYLTTVAVKNRKFEFLKSISKIVGEIAMGVAIAIAVISFLRTVQLSIGNVDLTLKTANIELIGALAFILGFYHEDTRKLLGNFREQVTKSNNTNQERDN